MNFEEDDSFEPGVFESIGIDVSPDIIRRDRHLWLRFKHLERVLPDILSVSVSDERMIHHQRLCLYFTCWYQLI